jgi:hypothetical protein
VIGEMSAHVSRSFATMVDIGDIIALISEGFPPPGMRPKSPDEENRLSADTLAQSSAAEIRRCRSVQWHGICTLSCVRARVSHGPVQEKGKAMQLSTRIKTTPRRSRLHWMETLSTSVASFLTGARFRPQPDLVPTKHSRIFYQRCVSPSAAPDFGMLVESDVSSKSSGMVP